MVTVKMMTYVKTVKKDVFNVAKMNSEKCSGTSVLIKGKCKDKCPDGSMMMENVNHVIKFVELAQIVKNVVSVKMDI